MGTEEPDPPQPQPQTLAAGELVWAKTKGRHHWWPARLHAPSPDAPLVSSLGADYSDDQRPATAVKPFLAAPNADVLAKANTALAFLAAVAQARATAVGILRDALTCPCARDPDADQPAQSEDTNKVVITGVANLSPHEFLAALGSAAVDPPAVGLLDHARLKSWVRALEQGWGPDGPGRYQRRSTQDLIDKIDLDMPAGEDDEGVAQEEEQEEEDNKAVVPKKTPKQKTPKQRMPKQKSPKQSTPKQRRRRAASPMEDTESGEDDYNVSTHNKDESGAGAAEVSGRRERKKSKYLSPPYTNIAVFADEKLDDSPKKLPPKSNAKKDERRKKKKALSDEDEEEEEEEKKVLPPLDNVGTQEVMLLVRSCGLDVSHRRHFPEAAEGFLGLFRSSVFAEGADHVSYKEHDCTGVENDVAKAAGADVPIAGLASESGKGKRGRKKKDQDGTGDSSVKKKKKTEKTSPTVATDVPAEASAEVTDSCASQKKKGEGVLKRGRKKKEQDGTGGSSTKRKKMDITPPMTTLGHGVPITRAIPIRQVSAEDIMGQVKSVGTTVMGVGVPDQTKPNFLVSKSPISAIMSGAVKSGEEQDLGDGGSVVNTQVNVGGDLSDQSAKQNEEGTVEATMPETGMNVDTLNEDVTARSAQTEVTMPMNLDILNGDVPAGSAQIEVTVPETGGIQVDMNVECVGVVDVPVRGVQMEAMELDAHIPVDTNEEGAVAYVPVRTGLLHALGGISQPAGGNKDINSAEVHTIQESYSFLEAMVPETYKIVEEEFAAGTNLVVPQDEYQKVEQASQKMTADRAIFANHPSPAMATTNGTTCPDPPNSAQKRRNKKPASYFAHPAELRVKFTDGVILPSKEELLAEFRRFGILVESECDIIEEVRGARVVFGKSTEAEAAYTKAEIPGIFGQFGPPFATLGLNYLDAITVLPPAAQAKPLIGLADMRKNVENMISSLKNGRSPLNIAPAGGAVPVSESLLGEMQRLLCKLDKTQPPGPSSSAGTAPPSS